MTIRNRELSQFGSFIYIDNNTKEIGITTEATPFVGIGTTNPTSKFHVTGNALITGVGTITTFNSTNGTITNLTGTAGTITTFNSTNGTITNLTGTNVSYSGISTVGSLSIGSTQVISSGRQLQNIASLDATTTATIESAIANAPNTFTDLQVAGVSTFTNGPILVGTATSTGTASQRLQVTGGTYVSGNAGIGTTNSTSKLHVIGDALVAGVATITNSSGTVNIGIGTTALLVQGTARVTNTLTIGSSSIILDGNNNQISIGTGFILNSNGISGSVGVITASSFIGELTGNAGTATSLASARDFNITGDFVTAPSVSFKGTQNVSLAATIAPNSITLGTYTSGDYIQSITGITSEIVITGGTGESSTPTVGLSSNLVLPGNLRVTGFSTFAGITSFTGNATFNQINITDVNAGIVSATAFYLNGSLLVDGALEVWLAAPIDNQYSIYRALGNVGIGTSTNLYKLSVNGQIQSQASQGTAPFVVQSTTNVPNLNADTVDGKHAPSGDIVGTSDNQTLTTKTLNLSNNTLTGTVAQFNTALSDDNFVTLTGTETLTNKTLTSPSIGIITNTGGTSQNIPSGIGTLVSTSSTSVITTLMLVNGAVSNSQLINSTLSGVALGSSLFNHIPGSYISGNNYNGSSAQTWNVNAVSANTADTIVARDSLKRFNAGHITVENITVSAGGTFFGDSAIVGSATTINSTGLNVTGIVTASGGFNIGIQSGGLNVTTGVVTALNFIGVGNTFLYNSSTKIVDISISGGGSLSISTSITSVAQDIAFVGGAGTSIIGIASTGNRFVYTPSTGNVGLGTASPAFKADIAGDVRVTSENKMRFGGTAGTTNFYIQHNSTTNSLDFVAG